MANDYLSSYQGIIQNNKAYESGNPSPDGKNTDSYDPGGSWDDGYDPAMDTSDFEDEATRMEEDPMGDGAIDEAFGGEEFESPETEDWNGEGFDVGLNKGENTQSLNDRQERLLNRIEKINKEVTADYQEAREKYDALLSGEGDLDDRETQMEAVQKTLKDLERDFKKLEKKADKLEREGIDVEVALMGDQDDFMAPMEEAMGEDGDKSVDWVSEEDIEILKTEINETGDQINTEREKVDEAKAEKEKRDKEEAKDLSATIQDARGYLTGDKDRYYWTGNASNGGKHIYDYYETDQKYARDAFDKMSQAAASGNWDSFTNFLASIPKSNIDNVGVLMYAVFTNQYPGFLEKLPSEVLISLANATASGSVGDKQDTYYIDASGGNYDSPGDNKRRRGNKDAGIGPGMAAEGFRAFGETQRQNEEAEAKGQPPPESPPQEAPPENTE